MTDVFTTIILQVIITIFLVSSQKGQNIRLMYIYLLVIFFDFSYEYFLYVTFNSNLDIVESYASSFRLLKGPLIYLFIRKNIDKEVSKRLQHLLFLPFVIGLIFNIIVLGSLFIDLPFQDPIKRGYKFVFSSVYPIYWICYLLLSLFTIQFRGKRPLSESLKYMRVLVIFLLVTVIAIYLIYFNGWLSNYTHYIKRIYSYLFLVQFCIIILMTIKTKHSLNHMPITDMATDLIDTVAKTITNKPTVTSRLSEVQIQEIIAKIYEACEKNNFHLDESASLQGLSEMLSISRHHITEAINVGLESNFYDVINKNRIQTFLDLLHKDPNQNISEAFYQCGFKSKSTFYKYFKIYKGISPSEYKDNLLKESDFLRVNNLKTSH